MNLILTDMTLPDICQSETLNVIDVTQKRIASCTGCFGCWTKTPGLCVINDDARMICDLVAQCEHLMIVSRLMLGCYALPMKRLIERLLPNQQPFIRVHEGETHHVQRYMRPVYLHVVAYGERNERADEVFGSWLARNVLNMAVQDYSVALADTPEQAEEIVRKAVSEWVS